MILFLSRRSTLTEGAVFFWQCRHRRYLSHQWFPVACSQGRHDSKSSLQCAHPVFWSCIWSTWIIKLLARLAGVTFVVVSREGFEPALSDSSYWSETDRRRYWIQSRQALCSFFPSFYTTHSILVFLFCSRSLLPSNFLFHTHFSVKLTFICVHTLSICLLFSLLPLLLLASLHLSPLLSSSSLSCSLIFFLPVSLPIFILPPWLNHRWFKIHTYVARHLTQTSVQTIFKPRLITSAPPGGRGKGKSRPYMGLQQLLKWKKKDTLFSYNMLSRQKHINVVSRMYRDWPFYLCLFSRELPQNVFVLTNKGWYWLNEIYSLWAAWRGNLLQLAEQQQRADTLFWWVAVWVLWFAVIH